MSDSLKASTGLSISKFLAGGGDDVFSVSPQDNWVFRFYRERKSLIGSLIASLLGGRQPAWAELSATSKTGWQPLPALLQLLTLFALCFEWPLLCYFVDFCVCNIESRNVFLPFFIFVSVFQLDYFCSSVLTITYDSYKPSSIGINRILAIFDLIYSHWNNFDWAPSLAQLPSRYDFRGRRW